MKKRDQILEAALDLFTERGFHNSPTTLIAKTAGVATGTLFHYFKTKKDLINELYLATKSSLAEELVKDFQKDASVEERLKVLWMNGVRWGLRFPKKLKFFQQFSNSPFITDLTRERATSEIDFLKQTYAEAIDKGLLKPIHQEFLEDYFEGYAMLTIRHFLSSSEKATPEKLDTAFQIFWDGITKR
jgi:AcrR family transcriptional regulator